MTPRLDADARKHAILDAALPLFAARGFHAVSTKELAREAGVSEALLYKHFPSKEALFEAMRQRCCGAGGGASALLAAEESTATLALCTYSLVRTVVIGVADAPNHHHLLTQLVGASLAEDGAYARTFFGTHVAPFLPKFLRCWCAAEKAGDLMPGANEPLAGLWFAHHAALVVALGGQPPLVDYGSRDVVASLTAFALRGLGLTPGALAKHANPESLADAFAALTAEPSSTGDSLT